MTDYKHLAERDKRRKAFWSEAIAFLFAFALVMLVSGLAGYFLL